jgi:serine/threonine protein kinase
MFGYCKKDQFLCLVTSFVGGGDLNRVIHDKSVALDFALKVKVSIAICSGMVYLHSKGIIHRDLKVDSNTRDDVKTINMIFDCLLFVVACKHPCG